MCIGFRVILLPFSIKATKQGQKMQEIQPELNKLVERARLSQSMGLASDAMKVPAVAEGGCLWFPNLAIPDPYFVLPVIAGVSTLFMTELGADGMNANGQIGTKYMMRAMSLFTIFVAAKMQSVAL